MSSNRFGRAVGNGSNKSPFKNAVAASNSPYDVIQNPGDRQCEYQSVSFIIRTATIGLFLDVFWPLLAMSFNDENIFNPEMTSLEKAIYPAFSVICLILILPFINLGVMIKPFGVYIIGAAWAVVVTLIVAGIRWARRSSGPQTNR